MAQHYGPWATSINACGNPQLSTFWRRRLTMLASASQTSFVLSRRNLFWLGAAALLMLALPTIHFATAGEGGVHTLTMSSDETSPKDGKGTKPLHDDSVMRFQGYVVSREGDGPGAGYLHLPVYVYSQFGRVTTRRELKITPDQEKKLIEISRASIKREEETRKQIQKDAENPSPEDRIAKQGEFQARLGQVFNSEAVRKQIETLLTKDQLTELRAGSINMNGISRLIHDKELHEKVGVSQRQTNELEGLVKEEKRQAGRLSTRTVSVEQRMEAVVTPEQWAKLERDIAANGGVVSYDALSFSEFGVLLFGREDERKQLGLTAKQQATVRELFKESQERFGSVRAGWDWPISAEHQAELARRSAELRKKVHVDIDRILTKEQSAVLATLTLRQCFLSSLNMALFSCTPAVEARDGLLSQIKLSPVQWKELCRLYDEKQRVNWQKAREVGEGVLKILSPEQQDTFFEEWGRDYPWTIAPPSAKKGGKAG